MIWGYPHDYGNHQIAFHSRHRNLPKRQEPQFCGGVQSTNTQRRSRCVCFLLGNACFAPCLHLNSSHLTFLLIGYLEHPWFTFNRHQSPNYLNKKPHWISEFRTSKVSTRLSHKILRTKKVSPSSPLAIMLRSTFPATFQPPFQRWAREFRSHGHDENIWKRLRKKNRTFWYSYYVTSPYSLEIPIISP